MQHGDVIGKYTVKDRLGQGGMGEVYLCHGPNGGPVAVKLVRSELTSDDTFLRRFAREARAAARIVSPHCVPLLDSGALDGQPYIVQQYVPGGSVDDLLRREGRLEVATTLRLCAQVADGLEALHANGLIHRDVKPGNILLDADGRAQITDFGLAKDWAASDLTRPGQAVGSLDYMAPEQIRAEPVTERTDVYALGCVMVECLLGKPPFADKPVLRVMMAHLHDLPPDPSAGRDDVSPALGQAVLRALEKDPADRPASPSAYAEALRTAADPG